MTEAAAQDVQVRIEFQQDQYWIDASARKHRLDEMTPAHLANVLKFCQSPSRPAVRPRPGRGRGGNVRCGRWRVHSLGEAWDWLESTPLIRAVEARPARLADAERPGGPQ